MKRSRRLALFIGWISIAAAVTGAQAEMIESLVGDQDSFGTDLPYGSLQSYDQIIAADPDPGDGQLDKWCLENFSWRHEFALPEGATVTAAMLTLVTQDIEDAGEGDGLGGEPYDDLLFLDGVEIPYAFDNVFTPDGGSADPLPSNTSDFVLGPEILPFLEDGELEVFLDPQGGELFDCLIVDFSFLVVEFVGGTAVAIDIKPGSDPNCFNNNGQGVIPVAILGSTDFDVTQIDFDSLLLDGLEVRVRGKKGPLCSFEHSNGDGFLDLVCHFEDEAENWTTGDADATLVGSLFDGSPFAGTDSICVRP